MKVDSTETILTLMTGRDVNVNGVLLVCAMKCGSALKLQVFYHISEGFPPAHVNTQTHQRASVFSELHAPVN